MSRSLVDPRPSIPRAYHTDERQAIQKMARDFAMQEVLPIANELDPVHGLIPDSLRAKMGDLGFFGILIPEENGGLGLGVFEYALITEELARAWMSVASIITRSGIAAILDPSQRAEVLPRAARGEWLGAFAMSEPGAGSDIASIRTRADKVDGGWLINGQKMWCTFADQSDGIVVVARTEPYDAAHRHKGIRRFITYKNRGEFPAGCTGTPVRKIGYHGWQTFELSFDDCFVPEDALLGYEQDPSKPDQGFARVAAGMLTPRIHTAARSIGLARGALEDSIKYVQEREQFGHAIGDFQATRFKIATMATEIELCRALMYEVAADVDAGEASDARAAMLKYAAAEMSERVTSEALQIHGGAGYTTDFPIERYWRDARLTKIFEGTSEIMQRLVSDRLLPPTPFR
ncbi:acyl-CoA dehydrogenase family protein [Rhodococcus sp. IEGM 1307]|uniref:acyl-CoA dehydrogenase family protein n=1 Tax=Rhodococcus sp. IEGM 1307 TaxID=3047091 RepID=UPI0024B7E494|nr:acyl-CoA dehydrogenase family protein [Rhodococcus sp. IEGM 1307]MDI9977231.1 acyl-CoA dehydrogenase family protein [Rhodococcus sp. IEGM 1307]